MYMEEIPACGCKKSLCNRNKKKQIKVTTLFCHCVKCVFF